MEEIHLRRSLWRVPRPVFEESWPAAGRCCREVRRRRVVLWKSARSDRSARESEAAISGRRTLITRLIRRVARGDVSVFTNCLQQRANKIEVCPNRMFANDLWQRLLRHCGCRTLFDKVWLTARDSWMTATTHLHKYWKQYPCSREERMSCRERRVKSWRGKREKRKDWRADCRAEMRCVSTYVVCRVSCVVLCME